MCACIALAALAHPYQNRVAESGHTISGHLVDPRHERPEGAVLLLGREGHAGSFEETSVAVNSDGSFITQRLNPGTYLLTVVRSPNSEKDAATAMAFELVRVGTADVSGVTVPIRRDTALTGKFRMESDRPGAAWPPQIVVNAFLALEGMPLLSGVVAEGAPQGKFVLRNAFGPRVLRCGYTLPPGTKWWPAQVLLDGVDITNVPTDFSAHDSGRLEIVFTQHPARIEGTVVDALGRPARAPWILVTSAESALQEDWATTNHVVQGNTTGGFSIPLMPGRYFVAAVPQTTFRFNPWVEARKDIRRFAAGGAVITLRERQATTVTLQSR
jgi:hypothetical protein